MPGCGIEDIPATNIPALSSEGMRTGRNIHGRNIDLVTVKSIRLLVMGAAAWPNS